MGGLQVGNSVTIVGWAHQVGHALLDLIYPPVCVGCGQVGSLYCRTCRDATVDVQPPLCPRCGRSQATWRVCQRCVADPPLAEGIRSVAVLEGALRRAIYQYKYGYVRDLSAPLSEMLVSYWQGMPLPADLIVPVPLHKRRLRERGYNQAALLAQGLGSTLQLPVRCDCLSRIRYTVSQTRLNAEERSRNVEGAFTCRGPDVRDRCVLLIDDVFTTGATLGACSRALLEGGARAVWALTLARAASTRHN